MAITELMFFIIKNICNFNNLLYIHFNGLLTVIFELWCVENIIKSYQDMLT